MADERADLDVAVAVGSADLDTLDDPRRHATCSACGVNRPTDLGQPFIALCGTLAVYWTRTTAGPLVVPPDACPACAIAACVHCGAQHGQPS